MRKKIPSSSNSALEVKIEKLDLLFSFQKVDQSNVCCCADGILQLALMSMCLNQFFSLLEKCCINSRSIQHWCLTHLLLYAYSRWFLFNFFIERTKNVNSRLIELQIFPLKTNSRISQISQPITSLFACITECFLSKQSDWLKNYLIFGRIWDSFLWFFFVCEQLREP